MRADQIVQQALALHRQGRLQEALALYQQALRVEPDHVDALHLMGSALLQAGQAQHALTLLEKAVHLKPGLADAHANLGVALRRVGRPDDAIASFERAVRLNHKLVEAQVGYATALFELGRLPEALERFDTALSLAPRHPSAHCNRGAVLQRLQRTPDALVAFDRAIEIAPQMAEAHANRANALHVLGRHAEALAAADRALAIRPGYGAALTYRGFVLLDTHHEQEALASFQAALGVNPADTRALTGQGRALMAMGQPEQALASFERALALYGGDVHAHFHKALALCDLDRFDDALASVTAVLTLDPTIQGAHHCRGNILTKLGRRAQALQDYRREYELHPETDYALGHYLAAALTLADWSDYEDLVGALLRRTSAGESAATPFELSFVCESGPLLRAAAESHARFHKPVANLDTPLRGGANGERIRVGYFSSDFIDHPVAHLISGVFAAHDRDRFEIFAYALGVRRDAYTDRVRGNVDRFIDCRGMSPQRIAIQARADAIDVAIDLNGYTAGAQTAVFATRVAPVQMSYIGYLGTMGATFMDYLVVDDVIAPPSHRANFTEKLISLPWYQCNDGPEDPLRDAPGRAHYGLPEDAFVFVSFNNVFKLTPDMFAVWMRILSRVPGSVLWLYAAEPVAQDNLKKEAAMRGVDPARIVFALGVPRAEHLARQRLADLMLDTFPYNGGATTSNALRAGLPVLTLAGDTFASRMGASLLVAAGAPELIAQTATEYEEKAVAFASGEGRNSATARTVANAHALPLYDPVAFVRHFERALTIAVERARAGKTHEDINVS